MEPKEVIEVKRRLFPPRPPAPDPRCVPPESPMNTDPFGSYTGRPIEQWEEPVQDVDDL